MKDRIREMLAFEDLTQEEKEKRGILGRLYGPCASISVPTRNGRGYNESLWENVFNDDITKEMFANGGIPMELDHPADREETDSSRIAAMMPEAPKKDKEGHLIAYCDLIDTPMGRIAYQLAKYGFKLGISSRGSGDIIEDENGDEIVDPDTYSFTTFDLVLLPAVKDARLTMTEGLDKNNMTDLKKALCEDIENAKKLDGTEYSTDEKKMMTEALEDLGIKTVEEKLLKEYTTYWFGEREYPSKKVDHGEYDPHTGKFADGTTYDDLTQDDFETDEPEFEDEASVTIKHMPYWKKDGEYVVCFTGGCARFDSEEKARAYYKNITNKEFKGTIEVSNEKPFGFKEELSTSSQEDADIKKEEEPQAKSEQVAEAVDDGTNDIIRDLQEALKAKKTMESTIKSLQERLAVSDAEVSRLRANDEKNKSTIVRLTRLVKESSEKAKDASKLQEELKSRNDSIALLNKVVVESKGKFASENNSLKESVKLGENKVKTLERKLSEALKENETKTKELEESLNAERNRSKREISKLTERLNKSSKLAEGYKRLANEVVDRYIESKAVVLGVDSHDIKSRLKESYSLDDIDDVCESLQSYNLNLTKLPFKLDKNTVVSIKESKPAAQAQTKSSIYDDEIDEHSLYVAGLVK